MTLACILQDLETYRNILDGFRGQISFGTIANPAGYLRSFRFTAETAFQSDAIVGTKSESSQPQPITANTG